MSAFFLQSCRCWRTQPATCRSRQRCRALSCGNEACAHTTRRSPACRLSSEVFVLYLYFKLSPTALVTVQVDCWAAGVLAYELVVGRPPFEVKNESKTAAAIMYKNDFPLPAKYSQQWADFVVLVRPTTLDQSANRGSCSGGDNWQEALNAQLLTKAGQRVLGCHTQALQKNPAQRPSAVQLLEHPWIRMHTSPAPIPLAVPGPDLMDTSASTRFPSGRLPACAHVHAGTACSGVCD